MSPHDKIPLGPIDPRWDELVWEAADGPILVEEMSLEHLRNAVSLVEEHELNTGALSAMRERISRLET